MYHPLKYLESRMLHSISIKQLVKNLAAMTPAFALLGLNIKNVWNCSIDDAYISFRYAKHLSEGYGLLWNISSSPVEGYTNFFLVVILALLHRMGLDILISAKAIGILSAVGTISLLFFVCKKLDYSYALGIIMCILFSVSPVIAIHAVSGLETMLFSFILLCIVFIAIDLLTNKTSNNLKYFYLLNPETLICICGLLLCLTC